MCSKPSEYKKKKLESKINTKWCSKVYFGGYQQHDCSSCMWLWVYVYVVPRSLKMYNPISKCSSNRDTELAYTHVIKINNSNHRFDDDISFNSLSCCSQGFLKRVASTLPSSRRCLAYRLLEYRLHHCLDIYTYIHTTQPSVKEKLCWIL